MYLNSNGIEEMYCVGVGGLWYSTYNRMDYKAEAQDLKLTM